MPEKIIEVLFEKIGHNGVSIGHSEGKVIFAYGILPGEKAKIRIWKEKKDFAEGELLEILNPSLLRKEPKEAHYLSCSPWQTFDYQFQVETKKEILKEVFERFAGQKVKILDFFPANATLGYRTKIEFSFYKEEEDLFLAFHKRGTFKAKIKAENGCLLADDKINKVALRVVDLLRKKKFFEVKSLVVRRSFYFDEVLPLLFVTKKENPFEEKEIKSLGVKGFGVFYSDKRKPSSTLDEKIFFWGDDFLKERVLGGEFLYPAESFFQNNIELFEKAILTMQKHSRNFSKIVDLFCGVGIIGILLKDFGQEIIGVEVDKKACDFALQNAKNNEVKNFLVYPLKTEEVPLNVLKGADLLVVDPPRPGLSPKLIEKIKKAAPPFIFYLSCNPITQARDYGWLSSLYQIEGLYGFDFYPNTPHIESLLILKKNDNL